LITSTPPILLGIAVLWFATSVAPGPNFIITTRRALLNGRMTGVLTALGIAGGTVVWGLAGFFGVHALFVAAPWLYATLRIAGSAYLAVLGIRYLVRGFRHQPQAAVRPQPRAVHSTIMLGMLTSLANPQTALSTASLFAATLPPQPSLALGLAAVTIMTVIATLWYGFVACVLTMRPAAAVFGRMQRWIDRVAGLAFLGFGTRLALER
jgi:threonine/homoserine/homoserine lactone efflux protein